MASLTVRMNRDIVTGVVFSEGYESEKADCVVRGVCTAFCFEKGSHAGDDQVMILR